MENLYRHIRFLLVFYKRNTFTQVYIRSMSNRNLEKACCHTNRGLVLFILYWRKFVWLKDLVKMEIKVSPIFKGFLKQFCKLLSFIKTLPKSWMRHFIKVKFSIICSSKTKWLMQLMNYCIFFLISQTPRFQDIWCYIR